MADVSEDTKDSMKDKVWSLFQSKSQNEQMELIYALTVTGSARMFQVKNLIDLIEHLLRAGKKTAELLKDVEIIKKFNEAEKTVNASIKSIEETL